MFLPPEEPLLPLLPEELLPLLLLPLLPEEPKLLPELPLRLLFPELEDPVC
jgi:hypothetical protein